MVNTQGSGPQGFQSPRDVRTSMSRAPRAENSAVVCKRPSSCILSVLLPFPNAPLKPFNLNSQKPLEMKFCNRFWGRIFSLVKWLLCHQNKVTLVFDRPSMSGSSFLETMNEYQAPYLQAEPSLCHTSMQVHGQSHKLGIFSYFACEVPNMNSGFVSDHLYLWHILLWCGVQRAKKIEGQRVSNCLFLWLNSLCVANHPEPFDGCHCFQNYAFQLTHMK